MKAYLGGGGGTSAIHKWFDRSEKKTLMSKEEKAGPLPEKEKKSLAQRRRKGKKGKSRASVQAKLFWGRGDLKKRVLFALIERFPADPAREKRHRQLVEG